MIDVERTGSDPLAFAVTVSDSAGSTKHRVTMPANLFDRLVGRQEATPEAFIEAAFRFLLDREPKEAILGQFDLSVISRYFPEFETELARYLERGSNAGDG